jgi:hypothetical protein
MTHLKADVATFLPHRQNNKEKQLQYFNTKMLPHQLLNGLLKY